MIQGSRVESSRVDASQLCRGCGPLAYANDLDISPTAIEDLPIHDPAATNEVPDHKQD